MQNSVWETGSLSSFTLVAWMLLGPLLSCLATTIICAEEGSQTDHFIPEASYIIFIIQWSTLVVMTSHVQNLNIESRSLLLVEPCKL